MASDAPTVEITNNVVGLRRESLRMVVLLLSLLTYVWLILVIWPVTGGNAPAWAWMGSVLLFLGLLASYLLQEKALSLALGILLGAMIGSIACAMLAYRSPQIAYLFVLPISLASVFSGPMGVSIVATTSVTSIAAINTTVLGLPLVAEETLLPAAVMVLITTTSWLSQHNLHTALEWVWNGFERACRNERISQERNAELRKTLKALDEAMYRLERTSYMLGLALGGAEEAKQAKQRFAQTISHELRTPLNLIIGFTELMAQSPEYYGMPLPGPYMRDLSIVHRNARHLKSLLDDVLDLARIEATEMNLILEDIDPAQLAREVVDTATSLVASRGLDLRVEIEPSLPHLRADPTRIRQVLLNLLSNAARFTEKGSVSLSVCRRGDTVQFSVQDTGIGIAEQDLPKMFEQFTQLHDAGHKHQGGMGLGLAISKNFVELHGGRIWVESELGVGSTFSFALPLHYANGAPSNLPALQQTGRPKTSTDGAHILLAVTRSLAAAALLTRYIKGIRTVVAHDLAQAHSMAQSLLPQAIVIDTASVPDKESPMEYLAETCAARGISVVACTLPGEEKMRRELDTLGYLTKPVSASVLWDIMRALGQEVDRVLIVDDDRDLVRLLARMLESPVRHYDVRGAYSGEEALEMLARWQPDLILLDLGLPDMSGRQIIRCLRDDPRWSKIPIVIITGQDSDEPITRSSGTLTWVKADGITTDETIRVLQAIIDATVYRRTDTTGQR